MNKCELCHYPDGTHSESCREQYIISTLTAELSKNCMFFKYAMKSKKCSHDHQNCKMYNTCKAVISGGIANVEC